jgi:hypothetical protein
MRYQIIVTESMSGEHRHIFREDAPERFTCFPAEVGNPHYDAFLESQGLTDVEVQAMTPDEWHYMV